jgi:hypothetical protein
MRYLPVVQRLEWLQPGRLPGLRELYREESRGMESAHFDVGRRNPEDGSIQSYRPEMSEFSGDAGFMAVVSGRGVG